MENEFDFELTTNFEYAHKGDMRTAQLIRFAAPTSKNMTECAFLKQAFFRALPTDDRGADQQAEKKTEISGDEVIMMLAMSEKVDLAKVLISAKMLFTSGVAMVDGEEKLTSPLADKMSQDDLENAAGKYMANFILASALRKLNQS